MRSLTVPLIVASFIYHPLVKAIATIVSYALLKAFVQAELINIGHKLLFLKKAITTKVQKAEAYNRIADSFIALALAAVISLFMAFFHFLPKIMMGVSNFVKRVKVRVKVGFPGWGKGARPKVKPPEVKPPEVKPPKAKPPKAKPTEPKPTEPKPTEPKPTEPKPTEPKPTEPKPTEPKPTEPKPTEPKPTETKPTEPKPTEAKPSEAKPTEAKPSEAKPSEAKPSEAKPSEAKPSEAKPKAPPKAPPAPTFTKPVLGGEGGNVIKLHRYTKTVSDVRRNSYWTEWETTSVKSASRMTGVPEELITNRLTVQVQRSALDNFFKDAGTKFISGEGAALEYQNTKPIPLDNIDFISIKKP